MTSSLTPVTYQKLKEAVHIGMFSPELIGKRVAVCGTLSMPHADMELIIKLNGGIFYDNVRDGLDYVVVGRDVTSLAVPGGCKVLEEHEFAELLRRKLELENAQ